MAKSFLGCDVTHRPAGAAAAGAALILIGLAAVSCGPHGATPAPSFYWSPAPSISGSSAGATAGAAASGSPGATGPVATGLPGPVVTPPTVSTPDPLASALDQLNQLINDINNSLSSSDASQQGGE
jgi:hypothetical protein